MKWNTAPFVKGWPWIVAWPVVVMLALIALSLGGMRDLLRANLPGNIRLAHTLVVFLTLLLFALLVLVVEYLTKRQLLSEARLAHEHLRMAMVAGKAVAWDFDVKTGRNQWVGDLQTMFGISVDSCSAQTQDFYHYVHPDDRQRVSEAVANVRANREQHVSEFRFVWEDGTVRWVRAIGKFLYSKKGDPERMLGTAVDITDERRVKQALSDSEDKFRRLVEQIGEALVVDDVNGHIVFANDRFLNLFGFRREELQNMTQQDYVAPEYVAELHDCQIRRMHGEVMVNHYEYEGIRRDGSRFWVDAGIVPIEDPGGALIGTQKLLRDITDRKRAEQALRESEERFRLVANTAPVMIWMSGTDKLCTYFNKPWLDFTGRTLEAEVGNGWVDSVYSEDLDRCLATYTEAFDRRESFTMEYRLRRYDGEYRWILDIGVPRFNLDNSFAGYIGSALDVTERKLAEEALAAMGRRLIEAHEEERSRIGRELHDDINQRLALLAVELDRWNQQSTSGPEIHEHIEHAKQSIAEIAADVQGLSHHLHSSKLEYLGLAAAADSFCRELSVKNMVSVRFQQTDIPRTLPKETSLCLFRVLQEALQNAVKHSGARDFHVELHGRADEIELKITDAGVGFDVDEGMNRGGLGLISMRERLQLVKGEFTVSSKTGQGTTIHARVPLKAQPYIQNLAG